MIDAGDIVLRRNGEQGLNISKNPLPKHKGTIGAVTIDEENSVDKVKVGLSQLFVRTTYEYELLEGLEFPIIFEGTMQNWNADYLPSRRKF